MIPVGDCCEIVSGATPKSSVPAFWDGDIAWVTPADLSALEGAYIGTTSRRLTVAGLTSCSAKVLPVGSVLLSSRAPIGHVAINTVPMATNQGFKSLIPKPGVLDAKYLYHWLRANKAHLQSLGNGATFKEISKTTVARVEIPVPSLEQQRRIAAILDQADTLRAKRKRGLGALDDLRMSLADSMFSKVFDLRPLEAVSKRVTVGHVGSTSEYFRSHGVPFLRTGNVGDGYVQTAGLKHITHEFHERLRKSQLKAGDVLISRVVGDSVRSAVLPKELEGANCANIIIVSPSIDLRGPVLAHFLRTGRAQRALMGRRVGSAQSVVNTKVMQELLVPVPERRVQDEFCSALAELDRQGDRYSLALSSTESIFAAVQQRAFAGEL